MSDQIADQYYTRFRGKVLGPFGIAQLRLMIERNQVTRLHELSPDGEVWKRLRDMPELRPGTAPNATAQPPPQIKTAGAPDRDDNAINLSTLVSSDATPAPTRRLTGRATVDNASTGPGWYYALGEQKVGPISADRLHAMAKEGHLDPKTLVWREGLAEWTSLKEAEFAQPRSPQPSPTTSAQSTSSTPASERVVASGTDQYAMVPWIRRAGVQRIFIILSFFCVPIVWLVPFFVVLTGDVFENKYDAQGQLKRWGALSKGLIIALGVLYAIGLYFLLTAHNSLP